MVSILNSNGLFCYKTHDRCSVCDRPAVIQMLGYAQKGADIVLCEFDAAQLARKLLEDICELKGDRHG